MKKTRIRSWAIAGILLCAGATSLYAAPLDDAIEDRDLDAASAILESAETRQEAAELEGQLLEAARDAVRAGDLQFAKELTEAVLLFNIDNEAAGDLYVSIEEAQRQQEVRRQEEQQEAERQRGREAEAERQEYIASLRRIDSENFLLSAALAPIHYDFYRGRDPLEAGALGADAHLAFRFSHPLFTAGLGTRYLHSYYSLSSYTLRKELEVGIWLGAPLWIGTAMNPDTQLFTLPLNLKLGFYYLDLSPADDTAPNNVPVLGNFTMPAIGFLVDRMEVGDFGTVSFGFDWLPLLAASEDIIHNAFAWETELDFPLFHIREGLDLHLLPRLRGFVVSSDIGTEWSVITSIAIGAQFYAVSN